MRRKPLASLLPSAGRCGVAAAGTAGEPGCLTASPTDGDDAPDAHRTVSDCVALCHGATSAAHILLKPTRRSAAASAAITWRPGNAGHGDTAAVAVKSSSATIIARDLINGNEEAARAAARNDIERAMSLGG
mmetsp:Transcript_109550/g.316739  ORF Transcript_109550/g.316739 Transcript_109550/m.316739 type:complete len:132 (-) Transcript_109550:100-495(-)